MKSSILHSLLLYWVWDYHLYFLMQVYRQKVVIFIEKMK